MSQGNSLGSLAASGREVIDYADHLVSGLTSEQIVKAVIVLVVFLLTISFLKHLLRTGKVLIFSIVLVFVVGLELAVVYDVTQVTDKAMYYLEPCTSQTVEIDMESPDYLSELEGVFIDDSTSLLKKVTNTRLSLLLVEVIERAEDNSFIEFKHFGIYVYSGTLTLVPLS